jgi:hypothetical protein
LKPPEEEPRRVECTEGDVPVKLSLGEEFYVQFHRHGSVGEDAEFEIEDESVVTHLVTETEYLHPDRLKPGWTGGDAERGRWFFKACGRGQAKLTIRTLFRFEVERTCSIRVQVD